MCGLFGFSGRKGKVVNINKLIILGLYNESRGKDSCGYYFNGNIEKGSGLESKFSEFVAKHKLVPGTLKTKVFMGHTRKQSSGGYGLEGAHPHVVDDDFVQTHNGTIKEIWPLCTKYGIDHMGMHVDSIGLANLLAKIDVKTVLEDYVGTAALAFTWKSKPEALYLYHGASRDIPNGTLWSERPLYILHQPEGMYYSSMKESLDAINGFPGESETVELAHNLVHEVIDGEFTDNKIFIDRSERNVVIPTPPKVTKVPKYNAKNNNHDNYSSNWGRGNKFTLLKNDDFEEDDTPDMITNETVPPQVLLNKVYYFQGKYYRAFPIANERSKRMMSALTGRLIIDRDRNISNFQMPKQGSTEEVYFFINGVMIDHEISYKELTNDKIIGTTESTFRILSTKSKYPIIQFKGTNGEGKGLWYHKGCIVRKGTFQPKFSDNSYRIEHGKTVHISRMDIL